MSIHLKIIMNLTLHMKLLALYQFIYKQMEIFLYMSILRAKCVAQIFYISI